MAQGGILGQGVKVGYSLSSPVSWTSVGQLLDVTVPGLVPDEVETTTHDATTAFKRFMRGLIDVSEMVLMILADLDETTSVVQDALFDLQAAGTTVWWRVEIPTVRDKSKYVGIEFQGWVKNWKPQAPIADKQVLEASVRFDGTSFAKYAAGASVIS